MEVCSAQLTIIRNRQRLVTLWLLPMVDNAISNFMFTTLVRRKIVYQNRER